MGPSTWMHRLAHRRVLLTFVAFVAFVLSCTDLAGPEGLVRPEPWQYAIKIALGAIISFSLIAPLVLRDQSQHRFLASPLALAIGRWSYGLFIWHLAALVMVFPMVGKFMFNGNLIVVFVLTTVLGFAMAAGIEGSGLGKWIGFGVLAVSLVSQLGFGEGRWVGENLMPKASRLNPLSGLKRMFGMNPAALVPR